MSILSRLTLLFAGIFAAYLAGLGVMGVYNHRTIHHLRQDIIAERQKLLRDLLEILGEPLNVFVSDYSPWDEMVDYVQTGDPEWRRINLEEPITTHHIDGAWVFNPDLRLVGSATQANTLPDATFPLPPETLAQIASAWATPHFFVEHGGQVLELRGAPIRPSDTELVIPAPLGWLFAARVWNTSVLENLAFLTDSQIEIRPFTAEPDPSEHDHMTVTTRWTLSDWTGQPLRELAVHYAPPALLRDRENNRRSLALFALFGATLLGALVLAGRRWVVTPIRHLTHSLASRDAAELDGVHTAASEFSALAKLVHQSFQHESNLRQAYLAFNAIDEAVFVAHADDGLIRHVNEGAVNLLGWPTEQLIGHRLDEFEALDTAAPFAAHDSTTRPIRRFRRIDHRLLDLEMTERTFSGDASVALRVSVARDVTLQKLEEGRRLRRQRLESLGTLAGGVAHDLNNMLTPVSMILEDLETTQTLPSPELLTSVRRNIGRAATMLRQLLTFGRGVEGERQPIKVARLFDDMTHIVDRTFPKSITLTVQIDPAVEEVVGDHTQIHQVLLNLCVNARDAMPQGGSLKLSAAPMLLDASNLLEWPDLAPGPYTMLEVADTGRGIPADTLERIFEPFYTTKALDEGTGLGLSTSLGIVKAHGGFIRALSAPGQGTRFMVLLPQYAPPPSTALNPVSPTPTTTWDGHGRRVIVVDDDHDVRKVLTRLLTRTGCQVEEFDGAEALERIHASDQPFDFLMTDLNMPGVDGFAIVELMNRERPQVPVFVLTGRLDDAASSRLKPLQIAGVIEKPFEWLTLLEQLHRVLD